MQAEVLDFARKPEAAEQAAGWIARIDAGDLSTDERQQLKDWLGADPAHKRLLDEHALLWATASQVRMPAVAAPASAPTRRRRWLLGGGTAAAGLAALLLLRPLLLVGDAAFAASHRTGVGEQQSTLLPDGSRTTLNAGSALQIAYDDRHRRVTLERGVGLFDVAKDRARPFEVRVGQLLVRAVGTRFLVQRHADGRVEVTVYEGVVELERPGTQPVRLGVGQVALGEAEQTQLSLANNAELERKLAWQQGRIVFDDTELGAALEEVNRYSAQPIELGDAELRQLRISGAFETRDIGVFLRGLEQGFELQVEQQDGRWIVRKR